MSDRWLITQAERQDLDVVVALLNEAADRLHAAGIEQWGPNWMTRERMALPVERGEVFLVWQDERAIATVQLTSRADKDFWTVDEQRDHSVYVGKLARGLNAPKGVGTALLRWSVHHAARLGYALVRLDAWAANTALHDYYRDEGWRHLRTCDVEWRQSGALFERDAEESPEVKRLFEGQLTTEG